MAKLDYVAEVKKILKDHAQYKPAFGDINNSVNFDDEHKSYALIQSGWENKKHVHGTIVHIEIINDKIWIQYDGTEDGVATELTEAGVPHDEIVLGFRHPSIREFTDYAIG